MSATGRHRRVIRSAIRRIAGIYRAQMLAPVLVPVVVLALVGSVDRASAQDAPPTPAAIATDPVATDPVAPVPAGPAPAPATPDDPPASAPSATAPSATAPSASAPSATAPSATADVPRDGEPLVVGVKTDYPPFGHLDAQGRIIGLEPDLAADLARQLDRPLELVSVTSANRLQRLETGAIDVVIATMGDTGQRRQLATLIEPNYYASGVTVLVPPDSRIDSWSDLRGQVVCATRGALYNRDLVQRHLLSLRVFDGTRTALRALRDGRCVAWIYDDVAIAAVLREPEWAGWRMPLDSTLVTPWSMAIAARHRGSELERRIADIVAEWHRSRYLIEAEAAWGLPQTGFLRDTHALWTETADDGAPLCRRTETGQWPPECRNQALLTAADTTGLQSLALLVKQHTGLDFSIAYDTYDRSIFLRGLLLTLALSVACIVGGLVSGVAGAVVADARLFGISPAVRAAITFLRMTPPLLQIYIVYFGIGGFVLATYGFSINGAVAAAGCLSLYAGASVAASLVEAAAVMRRSEPGLRLGPSTLPRALILAYGPVVGALINAVKATGLASTVAVPELVAAAGAIIADRGNAVVMMNLLLVVYMGLVLLLVWACSRLEGHLKRRMPA